MRFQAEADLGLLILFADFHHNNDLGFCQTAFSKLIAPYVCIFILKLVISLDHYTLNNGPC